MDDFDPSSADVLSPASSAVSGEMYKWKDKNENVVFSDTPPPPEVNYLYLLITRKSP